MYLPFDILVKVDIAAMANSLEVRVPLLNHHVVELAATMPTEYKLKPLDDGVERKHVLRQLARRWFFPERFITRPKMGFGVPVGDWMADELKRIRRSSDCFTRQCCRGCSTCHTSLRTFSVALPNATAVTTCGTCCSLKNGCGRTKTQSTETHEQTPHGRSLE